MKKIYRVQLITLFLVLLSGCAKDDMLAEEPGFETDRFERIVTSEQAKEFARQTFGALLTFNTNGDASATRAAMASDGTIEVKEVLTLSSNNKPALHVINFTDDSGFMIVSADKAQANPVVMFSDTGNFELSMLEEESPFALHLNDKVEVISKNLSKESNGDADCYAKWDYLGDTIVNEEGEEIRTTIELVSVASLGDDVRLDVLEQRKAEIPETRGRYKTSKGLDYISPGTAYNLQWGQANGYNADAPLPNVHLAGCAAVAIGQMCYMNKYPVGYEYSRMPYRLASTTESNPISRMLRDIGDKIPNYNWGANATGASTEGMLSAVKTLGYTSAQLLDYDFYRTYTNMKDGYPVIFTAHGISAGKRVGHAWLCNGYQEFVWKVTRTTKFLGIRVKKKTWYEYADYLYMNWGWYGSGNTWVDQEDWRAQHSSGEIQWNSSRRGLYYLIPRK